MTMITRPRRRSGRLRFPYLLLTFLFFWSWNPDNRSLAQNPAPAPAEAFTGNEAADLRAAWFQDAKIGLRFHWGLFSVPARAEPGQRPEWVMHNERIPAPTYAAFADQFTASQWNPRDWVTLAEKNGMGYIVINAKHHDGFALWASQSNPFNVTRVGAAKRDVLKELADVCRERKMKLGASFSLLDWRRPDEPNDPQFPKHVENLHAQIRELLTDYPISGLWLDGEWTRSAADWRSAEILTMVRKRQPLAVVNDRLGWDARGRHSDVDFFTLPPKDADATFRTTDDPKPWEAAVSMTYNEAGGYSQSPEPMKSPLRLLDEMIDIVSRGGNVLINVGPRPDGTIPGSQTRRLEEIGAWLKVYGEAFRGAARSPFSEPLPAGRVTTKNQVLYLFLNPADHASFPKDGILLKGLLTPVTNARMLDTGEELAIMEREGMPFLALPKRPAVALARVVKITLAGPPLVE